MSAIPSQLPAGMQLVVMQRLTYVTPLGVRFWDPVSGTFVTRGLRVRVYPKDHPERRFDPILTPGGAFVFAKLPGLREAENGAGDEAFWNAPPVLRDFVLEVVDLSGRFTPFTMPVKLPHKGWLKPAGADLSIGPGAVPLFSTAARTAPGVVGVIRAQLRDASTQKPAAGAVVVANVLGEPSVFGVADETGQVAVFFKYPSPPLSFFAESPPASQPVSLYNVTWPMQVRARYKPAAQQPNSPPFRNLEELFNQPFGVLLAKRAPDTPLGEQTVTYGRELVLQTEGDPDKVLYVSPAP